MTSMYSSEEVGRIVRGLAGLPGSSTVNLVAKRFPRFGAAEHMTHYQEKTLSARSQELNQALEAMVAACREAEDIIISVEGLVDSPAAREQVEQVAQEAHQAFGVRSVWDTRVQFGARVRELPGQAYVMTLFTDWQPSEHAGSD